MQGAQAGVARRGLFRECPTAQRVIPASLATAAVAIPGRNEEAPFIMLWTMAQHSSHWLTLARLHKLATIQPAGQIVVGALLAPRPRGAALGAAPAALCPAPGRRMHGGHGARWRERNATMRPGRAERARWTPTEKRLTRAGHCCDRSRPTLWLLYFPRRLLLLQVTWQPWQPWRMIRRCSASASEPKACCHR